MNNIEHEIQKLLMLTEDELLGLLGDELKEPIGLIPTSSVQRARDWLEQAKTEICSSVCCSIQVQQAHGKSDTVTLVAAIADALGGAGFLTAATLLAKRGVEEICKEEWRLLEIDLCPKSQE